MKDCSYYEEQISPFLDGMLLPQEADMLVAHLEQCPKCRALYQDMACLSKVMYYLEATPPAGFSDTVLQEIRQVKEKTQKVRQFLSGAAVFLIVLMGGGDSRNFV